MSESILLCHPVNAGPVSDSSTERIVSDDDRGIARSSSDQKQQVAVDDQGWPCRRAMTTMRIPCKARGLMDGHNSRTAYLEVPPNAPHGMLLICSHPACACSGRRFRYCAICEIPVAKRNFNKRHSHGEFVLPAYGGGVLGGDDVVREEVDSESETSGPKRQRLNSFGGAAVIPTTVVIQPNAANLTDTETEPSLTDSERAWLELFHKRPKTRDVSEIEKWTTSVVEVALAVSDEHGEEKGGAAGQNVLGKKDIRLLHERLLSSCSILEDETLYENFPFNEFEW